MFRNKLFFEDCCVLMIYLYIQHTYISSYFILLNSSYPCTYYPVLYPSLSYSVLSFPSLSYSVLLYPSLSYSVLSFPSLSYSVLSCPSLSYSSVLCYPDLSYSILFCPDLSYSVLKLSSPILFSHILSEVYPIPSYPILCCSDYPI